jgi:hypothetical protein
MANAIAFPCDPSFIESFAQELEALPPKPAAARHNVISQLLPQIEGMLEKGYTLAEGHARFLLKGIACSFETFRRHVRKAQAQRDWNREHQGTRTAVEPVRFDSVSHSASVPSPVSLTPERPIPSAVHSVASAQVATEERSPRQSMAEPMVMASVDGSPADREAQAIAQQWVEPEPSAPDLAQAIAVDFLTTAPVAAEFIYDSTVAIEEEGASSEASEHEAEIRKRFLALSTPRMSQEEKRKHFYYNKKEN